MPTLEYQLGEGMKRKDGVMLSEFDRLTIPLDSIVFVRSYINAQSGSEYHFTLGFDPRCPSFIVFCDDSGRTGSEEYLAVIKKMSARLKSEIDPATGEGHLVKSQSRKEIADTIAGIFDDFGTPNRQRSVVVDYKTT